MRILDRVYEELDWQIAEFKTQSVHEGWDSDKYLLERTMLLSRFKEEAFREQQNDTERNGIEERRG